MAEQPFARRRCDHFRTARVLIFTPAILFDTDPGVDDALALLYLHRHPDADLVGLTTVAGNASIDVVTRNARYLAQRFGMRLPIARGAAAALGGAKHLAGPSVHGRNGLGDVEIDEPDYPLDSRPAHRLIVELVRERPGEITLVAVGMLTNLALALAEDPGIAALVRGVVIMGGSFVGHSGNRTPVAEANVESDPAAADIVMTAPWPVRAIGLNVTERVVMSAAFLATLRAAGTPEAAFIYDITRSYERYYATARGVPGIFAHDATAAVCALDERPFTFARGPIRVVRDGVAAGLTWQRLAGRAFAPNPWDGLPDQDVAVTVDAQAALAAFAAPFLRT